MKKKIILLALVMVMIGAGSAFAGGIDFQVGAGYNGIFPSEGDSFPAGFTAFGGVGFGILPTLSIGGEYEFGMTWNPNASIMGVDTSMSVVEHLPKAYVKFNALNILTVTGLAGVDIQSFRLDGNKVGDTTTAFTAGARVSLLFAYAQYLAVFNENSTDSRISIGAVFSK